MISHVLLAAVRLYIQHVSHSLGDSDGVCVFGAEAVGTGALIDGHRKASFPIGGGRNGH